MNIDCRWAPTGIAKLWVSLPKQGVAMATISRRITGIIIGEHKLQGIMIKRRNSKNGYTTYEICGPQEVIKPLSDPGQWEKKCWITMYNTKFLLPTDYGPSDESTLKMGVKQPSPMNPALRSQNVQENIIIDCFGLGSSREYVAELVKHYDLVALQETWLFPWDLAVPSTLGIDVNSFSLSSNDVTNLIKAGLPYGGITFIWHRDFGCNIQVKRYESERILGLSVTINGL